jgi:hypothetical protein
MTKTDRIISALYFAKSDNREKMLSDLILNVLYTINEPININSIIEFIKDSFHLEPIKYEVQECLNSLVENKSINFKDNLYFLTENTKNELYSSILKGSSETEKRQHTFHDIVKDIFDGSVNEKEISKLWSAFNEYLIECFMTYGRKAIKIFLPYEIEELAKDDVIIETAYKKLDDEKLITIFKQLIIEYPERLNEIELRYLTLLASRAEKFYSLGIEKKDYDKIQSLQIKDLIVLVDTNILYSILNLHVHPEKTAIAELIRIAKEKQVDIRIVYLPKTYSELQKAKNYLEKLIPKESFKISQIQALLNSNKLDPFARQYYESKLKNSEFPHPSEKISYAMDFLKQLDVIIYNNRFPHLEENETYINSKIAEYLDFQRYYNNLCDEKGYDFHLNKDDKKIEHDIFLRESVKDLKSKFSNESELRFICLTLDRSLVHFDNYTLRREGFENSKVVNPSFISPSIFIKKIRPFIPIATNNYRKAFISSLTAPSFEKENVEETILVQKSMTYFKNLGIEDEEIILNCIKRELFLEDFAKHEKDKTSENFIKSEIAIEIDKLKKINENLELNLTNKEIEKSTILEEKKKFSEEKENTVHQLEETVNEKETAIISLETRLKKLEEEKQKESEERQEEKQKADLKNRQDKWEIDKANFINHKLELEIPKLRKSVRYFVLISLITVLPVIVGFILKANKFLSDWIESLGQNQWWVWGSLTFVFLIEILGRSYLFNKEKMKTGWLWLCAYFNKNLDREMISERKIKFDAEYLKNNGEKPTV